MYYLLVAVIVALVAATMSEANAVDCKNESTSTNGSTPLYVLTQLPSVGLAGLTGARLARDEVNSRSDLLPGYDLQLILQTNRECCHSGSELGTAMTTGFLDAIRSPCRPVLAAIGLDCSAHTAYFSSVAGRFGVLHFSVANSPIFETEAQRFPHLWRFFGSATIYAEAVLAIMDQLNWTKIGIVHNTNNYDLAKYLQRQIKRSPNKKVEYNIGLGEIPLNQISQFIKQRKDVVSTLVLLLDPVYKQDVSLLLQLNRVGLTYPQFTYICLDTQPVHSMGGDNFKKEEFYNFIHGHIFLQAHVDRTNDTQLFVSGHDYKAFLECYDREFRKLDTEQNFTEDLTLGSFLYDQIWTLALAVNKSIPGLKSKNLHIENFTIGQLLAEKTGRGEKFSRASGMLAITEVIEEQLADVRFQGASGWVEFNQYHGVSIPVDVFWMVNGTSSLVGVYNPLNSSHFKLDITGLPVASQSSGGLSLFFLVVLTVGAVTAFITFATTQLVFTTKLRKTTKHSIVQLMSHVF